MVATELEKRLFSVLQNIWENAGLLSCCRNYFPMCADFRLFFSFLMSTQMYISSLKGNQGTWGEKNTADNFWVSSFILSKEKLTQPRKGTDKPLRQPNSFSPSKTEEIHTQPHSSWYPCCTLIRNVFTLSGALSTSFHFGQCLIHLLLKCFFPVTWI